MGVCRQRHTQKYWIIGRRVTESSRPVHLRWRWYKLVFFFCFTLASKSGFGNQNTPAAGPAAAATPGAASGDLLEAFTPLGRPEVPQESKRRNPPQLQQDSGAQNAESTAAKPRNTTRPPTKSAPRSKNVDADLDDGPPPSSVKKPVVKSQGGGIVIESTKPNEEEMLDSQDSELDRPTTRSAPKKKIPPQRLLEPEPEEVMDPGSRDLEEAEATQKSAWSKRAVKVNWKAIRGARTYLLEISNTESMDQIIVKKQVSKTEAWIPLKPGKYFYRVDGKTGSGRIIETDEVFELVVNPQAPDLLEPADLTSFSKRLTTRGVDFSWQSGFGGSSYIFEVIGESGKIYRKKTIENAFSWLPPAEGVYYWRVGFITPTGRDWSKYRSFKIMAQAIKKPLKPDPTGTRKSDYSAIVRLGVAVNNYTNKSADSDTRANGSALSNVASAELRWRGGKSKNQTWTWSGALNLEIIQSKVLGATFNLPRYYARVFFGKETAEWRFGPLAEVGRKQGAIFLVENETEAKKAEVTRLSYGGGAFGVYRPYETNLGISGILVVKQDSGGTVPKTFFEGFSSNPKEKPLNTNVGIEAGMGLVYILGPKSLIEGRLRYLKESYSWPAARGGESFSNQTLIIFDFGYGFRF